MNIENKNINEIKPYPKNAKQHPKKQVDKIANSISKFGFNQPIVLDKDNVIIVGHGRYFAAQTLGMEEVPTITVELSDEDATAYRLADNKLNESDWDMELVIEDLKTLSLEKVDLTGFDSNLVLETEEDDQIDIRVNPDPETVLGDIYELGKHKIICGDATKQEDYDKLLGDEKARLIFTDPPYSVDYVSQTGKSYESEEYGGSGGRIFNDDKNPEEALKFYTESLKRLYDNTSNDVTIYWWYANSLFPTNLQSFNDTGWRYSQTCFWLKEHFVFSFGQLYHRVYEPCMVGWKKGKTHFVNGIFSNLTEFWSLYTKKTRDYVNDHIDLWFEKRDTISKYIHPTQKPVRLAERALKRSSEEEDIVLDTFGGSGSTMIACEQLNRKTRMMELDPKYVDAIVSRWCQFKENPEIIKNGEKIVWSHYEKPKKK